MKTDEFQLPKLLFIGAFPPVGKKIFGGNVTACRILLDSSFVRRFDLYLVDSTQISNPPPKFLVRLIIAIKRMRVFIKKIHKDKPDVVLAFCSTGASLLEKCLMIWYARYLGIPGIIFPRGGALIENCKKSKITSFWVSKILGGAEKFFCQGTKWQQFAMGICGFSRQNAPIVPNWTASQKLLNVGKKRELDYTLTQLKILYVGWVEKGKGILDLVKAANYMVSMGKKDFMFTIAGDGNAMAELKRLISHSNMENYFNLLGWVDLEELIGLYSVNEIFILPSHAEGLPNAMIEAMAAGLAVIVTPVGNIPDVIRDESNGIIIEPANPKMIAEKIIDLSANRDKLKNIACNAKDTALNYFSVEPVVDIFENEIEMLLNSKKIRT